MTQNHSFVPKIHSFVPNDPKWDFIPRTRFFERQKIHNLEPIKFLWFGRYEIVVPARTPSDGMTMSWMVEVLTLRRLNSFGPGMVPAMLHDYVCASPNLEIILPAQEIKGDEVPNTSDVVRKLTKGERALIFKHALEVKPMGMYQERVWKAVAFGSKYLGYC